jgi:hypothetical protein
VSRAEFKALAEAGSVTDETPVFDLSVTRVRQAREGGWERPAGDSWHRRYLAAHGAP